MPVPRCVPQLGVIAYCGLFEDVRTIEEPPATVPVGCELTTMVLVEAIIDLTVLA